DAQVDDWVFVCRSRTRSRIGCSRSRLFRLPPSQTLFDPPRASIPPPLAGPSSSARTFPLAHTDNAFPPPFSLPLPFLIPPLLNSEPLTELSCTSCTPLALRSLFLVPFQFPLSFLYFVAHWSLALFAYTIILTYTASWILNNCILCLRNCNS
ncbi:hypothetical protein B0H14DRAFT_2932675, partial [Mycena olivaceomarginata]